jgi:hypothetical protein
MYLRMGIEPLIHQRGLEVFGVVGKHHNGGSRRVLRDDEIKQFDAPFRITIRFAGQMNQGVVGGIIPPPRMLSRFRPLFV